MPKQFFIIGVFTLLATGPIEAQDSGQTARRANGYQGIWFTLGQFYGKGKDDNSYARASRTPVFPYGDKYSGGLGTYTAKHTPLAIYCREVNKTFFVYGGTTAPDQRRLLCMISYYDHNLGTVPRPVVVHDKSPVDDPHDNPSLAIDAEGHVWVFVSGRGRTRPGFKYRSVRPYDINQFDRISEEEMTYPQPHVLDSGDLVHLFTKYTGVRELYWETSRDGTQWSDDQKLAGIREAGHSRGGHYQTSATDGKKIGTFFNRHPNGNVDRRTDLYYVETNDGGESWSSIDGEVLQTPLTEIDSPARVVDYALKGRNVYLKHMDFDTEGNPVLLYLTSKGHEPGPPNDPREFWVVRWDGERWRTSRVCAADHNYDMGSLYLSDHVWRCWVPSGPGPQPYHSGGEIAIWESADLGATWGKVRDVTESSVRNHNYIRRPLAATDPFFAFWADGDPTRLSESHLYFSDSSGTDVRELPYKMDQDSAVPIRP